MRKLVFVLLVLVAFSPALFAQKVGIEAGYSFAHLGDGGTTNAQGFEVQPMFYFGKHFAAIADFSGHYADGGHLYSYLFGPAYVIPVGKKAEVNVHYLFGAATAGNGGSESAFAMAPGAALDFKVAKNVWIRPAEFDWVITHFEGEYQNKSFRYGAGLIFKF